MDSITDFPEFYEENATESEFTTTDGNYFGNLSVVHNDSQCSLYGEPFPMFLIGGLGVSLTSLLGMVGNILCMIILTRRRMRTSTSVILLGLSVSDFCFVTVSFLFYGMMGIAQYFCVWSQYKYIIFPVMFPILLPLLSASQIASTYFTVSVTVERFIVVYRPLQARSICTVKNAIQVSILIASFAILFTLPSWWGYTYIDRYHSDGTFAGFMAVPTALGLNWNYKIYYGVWFWLIVGRVIPFTVLAVLNIAIYKKVRQANTARKGLTQSDSNEISLAKMLIWIVTIFLVCNLLIVYLCVRGALTHEEGSIEIFTLSGLFLNFNSAVNFIIYCLVGGRFRETCTQLFYGRLKNSQKRNSGGTIISYINSYSVKLGSEADEFLGSRKATMKATSPTKPNFPYKHDSRFQLPV